LLVGRPAPCLTISAIWRCRRESGIGINEEQRRQAVKTSLVGKVVVTSAVFLTVILPLMSGSPQSPVKASMATLTSPLQESPSADALAAGRLINVVPDHTATPAMPKTPTPPAPPKLVVRKLQMTPSGLVSKSLQKTIKRCYNTTQNVWLTFDDGYTTQDNLNSILGTLKANKVRGRFFLIGSWARQHPDMVNQIVAAGHFVENHTDRHAYLGQVSDPRARQEIRFGQASNSYPKLLRPPYGDGVFTVRLYNLAQEQGYLLCQWNVDTKDWAGAPAPVIVNRVLNGDWTTPPARAGDTILMHLVNTQTRYALPALIRGLRAKGLTLDPLP
jgi:peptidoglycan/xylan/chitin deacetylase (PgdA/CDA1 family)